MAKKRISHGEKKIELFDTKLACMVLNSVLNILRHNQLDTLATAHKLLLCISYNGFICLQITCILSLLVEKGNTNGAPLARKESKLL
jgi:hypothetical protein